jgi:TnpA family transposase
MDESRGGSRIVYPKLFATLTEADLASQFRLAPEERAWAGTVARRGPSMVVLLTQLKVFQSIGHFLPLTQIPATALSYIAKQLSLGAPADVSIDPRTTYRQNSAIRTYLGVTPWGASARAVASKAVAVAAETRLDPADLVNAAIDALIRERCELPSLSTLLRLAGNAHRRINSSQWQQVHERLTALDVQRLDDLLTPSADSQDSPFAVMCRGAGKATRDNLKALIAHYEWLRSLPDPAPMLTSISEAKIGQWANEAQRLKARELREYVAPRRYALVLAALRDARGRVLDDMTAMLLKFSKKVVWISQQRLAESHVEESTETGTLIAVLAEMLGFLAQDVPPAAKIEQLEATIIAHGGLSALQEACKERTEHEPNHWQPFADEAFWPYRRQLLALARTLPLKAARPSERSLIKSVRCVADEPSTCDSYTIWDLDREFLPPRWRALTVDAADCDPRTFNRRYLEVATILELAESINGGAIHVDGSLSYDDFWGRLPSEANDPAKMSAYASERGWDAGGKGFTNQLREHLQGEADRLDLEVGLTRTVQLDHQRRPIVPRIAASEVPASVAEAVRLVMDEMPERSVLEALANTAHWVDWTRHFGLPSRMSSGIANLRERYLITTFAYGCGLGATQAARHFGGAVLPEELSFVDRRHIDIANLRAGSADLQNLFLGFDLTKLWGRGESAAADGTHFETFRNNLMAARHFRYGRTGGIAYRHVSDNYIALFSRFIGCGIYEATYILDILQNTLSEIHPTRLYADSHGQSAHVFALAYLLGIELLPRIRTWKRLKLYRPSRNCEFEAISHLFSATVDWPLIERHYPDFIRLALAIHSGELAPSAVLTRINSQSSRDPFSHALQELGHAVRTRFLLRWTWDEELRHAVHKGTTKVERNHQFTKFLNFGGEGGLKTNNPADQEKAIVYNELVANAVAAQTVNDLTHALNKLHDRGINIAAEDLAHFSPYPTSKVKRFGDYPAQVITDSRPIQKHLPVSSVSMAAL